TRRAILAGDARPALLGLLRMPRHEHKRQVLHGSHNPLSERESLHLRGLGKYNGKLIPSITAGHVGLPDGIAYYLANYSDSLVAGGVPVGVVDRFQLIH